MVVRDELILVLDLTSTILRAGVGVHDLIRGPLVELPTRLGRKLNTTGTQVEDFLVGQHLFQAEHRMRNGGQREFEDVNPLRMDEKVGFEVVDWVGLEAVFRYALHTSLALARPPISNSTVLSIPPSLPPSTVDQLHRLLFERLLVPSLLLSTRPFFAAAAAGVLSCLVLDLGYRGEGSEISVVHDNMVFESAGGLRLPHLDEGVCDDYCALRLLEADPTLPQQLGAGKGTGATELGPGELVYALRAMVTELKTRGLIGFESPLLSVAGPTAGAAEGASAEEEGSFDVAKAIVDGKVSDMVKKKGKGKAVEGEEEAGDFVTVVNPFAPPPPAVDLTLGPNDQPPPPAYSQIRLGPARHRYLEPLFIPSIISSLAPSSSAAAAALNMAEYERFATPGGRKLVDEGGVHEAIGAVISRVSEAEVRHAVSETVVVVSSGRIGSNKALHSTLAPLLSPFRPDPDSATLAAIAAEGGVAPQRGIRVTTAPEYFASFKERAGDWGVYLGGCIVGKLLIGDSQSKLFMSKADYIASGPAHYRILEKV